MEEDKVAKWETYQGTGFNIEYEEDGVYLTVSSSPDGMSKEDESIILSVIKRKRLMGINSTAVFEAMFVKPNTKVRIAQPQKEVILDQEIQVRVSNGGMEAFATLLPEDKGAKLTKEKVMQILRREGIVFGIDESAIERMLKQQDYYNDIPIAYGKYPKKGQDAKLIYHIDFNRVAKPIILDDGTVDYRNLDLIRNVSKGQQLATLVPPTEGIPGKTVYGKTIEAMAGKNLVLPKGKNVVVSEDGCSLLAAIDGKAEMIDGKIHVQAIYEVMGNVDNSTGNIDFVGNVIVNGNVLTGFEVKAGGYIEVRGVVEGATLSAVGNVVLKQGMQGMGKGSIISHGDVIARFIENGTVAAKGDIIAEAILHSNINCGGKVKVVGRKGLIAGGSVSAGHEISAFVVGSPMSTTTELEVGISPMVREEHSRLCKELDEMTQELKKADQILNLLRKMESKGELALDKANMRLKAIKTKLRCSQKFPEIKARIAELDELIKAVSLGRINVRDHIHPGVKITIGSSILYIKDKEQHVTFVRESGEITRTSYLG